MRFSTQTTKNLYFQLSLGVWLLLLIFFQIQSFAQTVIIQRDGFPYCETFTESTYSPYSQFGASAAVTAGISDPEGDGFLRLTSDAQNDRGYAFIDLPFSSVYGIKVSFEYFAYGGIDPLVRADGLSFFLFDGNIQASDFRIGGRGGSLGYAPHQYSNGSSPQLGLKGAYFGIGFDSFNNFGNEYEGRTGGFASTTPNTTEGGPVPDSKKYPNSVVIRGPESDNYKFFDGKRTNNYPTGAYENANVFGTLLGSDYVWTSSVAPDYPIGPPDFALFRRFTISSQNKATECNQVGYRKVFIELKPATPLVGFYVTVYMIVNTDAAPTGTGGLNLETIFKDVYYPYASFSDLKMGFAASTGDNTAFHEIRNVTAEVYETSSLIQPTIAPISPKEVCVDAVAEFFEFNAQATSLNSFIRCVQLNKLLPPSPPPPSPPKPKPTLPEDCGFDNGVCAELCDPLKEFVEVDGGRFEVELIPDPSDPSGEKQIAKIKFIPTPGFIGEAVAYVQVLDNYGYLSDPQEIKAIVNPYPNEISNGQIDYPSCDGQDDGRIFGVEFGDLVAGFDYNWTYTDVSGAVFNLGKTGASVVNSGSTATFELQGINLGTYTLSVSNPSDSGGCPESVDIVVDQELGTPVTLTTPDKIICEGDDVSFVPVVNNPSGASPQFLWYTAADRTGGALTNGTRTIDGATVQVTIAANGQLTLDGLTSAGTTPKLYDFFVETNNLNVASGNFCPYLGNVLSKATVQVYPPLGISATDQEDWCLTSTGSISASTTGLATGITFTLLNSSGNTIATNSIGNFTGLAKGDYQVYATSATPSCTSIILPVKIEGPAAPLSLAPVSTENSYCGIANGSLKFNLLGGNLPYSITINGNPLSSPVINGNEYTHNNLAAGTYIIRVVDGKGCQIQISQVIATDPLSQFGTTKDEICEGETAILAPTIVNLSSSVPVYKWYYKDAGGNYVQITNGLNLSSVIFAIDGSNKLSVSNLAPQATPYTYYLNVTGTKVCDQGYIPAEILVNPSPVPAAPLITQVTCNGAANGVIQAQLTTGNLGDFEYSLIGNNGVNRPFTKNSGLFNLLPPGTYELTVKSAKGCEASVANLVITEPSPLALAPVSSENSYCGLANGSLKFNLLGGNFPYSITINGNPLSSFSSAIAGTEYTISGLATGTYNIRVVDGKGCQIQISQVISADPPSVFGTTKDEICEGEVAIISPTVVTQSSSVPVYKWYYQDGAGNYIQITNGLNLSGVLFAINGSNQLSVSNLTPQATPYTYYLNVTGTKVCDQGYIPAEILVNPSPVPAAPLITQVTCKGASNGIIQAQLTSGNLGDFEYSLIGNNGVNKPFTKNSGLFNLLPPGTYQLTVKSAKGCEASVKDLIVTEPSALLINQVSKTDATCALNNGTIRFTVTGATPDGTGKYIIKVNSADISTLGSNLTQNGPTDFTLSNLAPGPYKIEVEDTKGCKKELTVTLLNTAVPVFDAQDVTVCEGTNAVLTPQVVSNTIGAIPVYTWSYENPSSPGQYIQINNGDVVNGATYTLSNGILTIKGLKYALANYKYYLSVTGTNVCPAAPIQAEVKVLKIPTAVFETVAVSCFGDTNGQIKLTSVDPAGPNTFTIVETGASNSTGNFSNLKAGTYTIRIKETGSPCQSESKVVITEPAKLELLNPLKSDPTCNEINGSVSFDVKGGVKNYQILINGKPIADYSFGQTGDRYEIKNLAPGTYSVQITDTNACVVNQPNLFVLINDDGLTVTINPLEEEKCVGSSVILNPVFGSALPVIPTLKWYKDAGLLQPITSSPTPDSDNITYQINPSGALTITGLQVGDYKYFLEISGPGICTLVEEANVKIVPQILADIVVVDITCFGQKDGSITVTPSGGNGNFEIRLNGGAYSANNVYPNLAAGKYAVDIRNDIGCVTSYQAEVKGPAGPISINKPSIIRASCDLDNGSIEDLVISGGWNSYVVEWRFGSATGAIIPGDLTGAKNLAPGTYFLLVSDLVGCKATFTFVIGESSDPVYAVVPPINSCLGSKVSIRPIHLAPNPSLPPAAATEIRWYTGPGQTGLISNGADPSITGVTYTIDDTDWLNPLLEIEGLPVGLHDFYFFVVCTGQEIKIETTVFSTPEVTFETDPITCFGDKNGKIRVISGDQPVYTYSVNSVTPLSRSALEAMSFGAGTYNIVIATPAGCSQDLNLTIDGPSAALASSPLTKIDPGCGAPNGKLELVVTGGWLPYTLDISKDGASIGTQVFSQSDILIDGFRSGVYQINITDSEGCTVTTNSVTMVDGPTQILVDEEAICEGSNAVLVPSLDPVASGATFQWFLNKALTLPIVSSPSPAADGNIYQIDPSTGVLTVSGLDASPTDFTYYVTVAGSTICEGFIGEGKVRVYGNPAVSSSVQNEVCYGEGGQITINASGGSGSYTYSLNGGAFVTSNVFNVSTGTYNVEVRTPEGCSHIVRDIIVSGPSGALVVKDIEQNNPTCELNNGDFRFTISGGYPPYTINYTKNSVSAGTSSAAPDGSVLISGIGVGTYAFTVTDKQGCKINLPNSFVFTEVPTEITAADDEICAGETAELIPSVSKNIINPQFSWYFDTQGNNPVNSGTVNGVTYAIAPSGAMTISGLAPNASGHIFYVSATGQGICGLVPKPVKVNVNGIPNLKVSNPSVVCDPQGSVDLTNFIEGFNPAVYDYNVLSPAGSLMRLEDIDAVQVSGDYRVSSSLKGKSCWNQAQRIRVIISDTLLEALFEYQIDLGGGLIVNNGDIQIEEAVQFDDLSKGKIILWEWNFGDGYTSSDQSPTHTFLEKGAYTVTLRTIDEFGCESIYQMVVNVFDDFKVMVPNAFTPDGAKNKYFKPYYRGISSMEFYIFNTWGELIYESKSLEDTGWDGTLNGTPTPNGNYVYKGRFVSRSGEVFTKSGVFILIR